MAEKETNWEEVEQRINKANDVGAISLDLSNLQLTEIPNSLYHLTNITGLNISNNKISDLIPLKALKNLTDLNLDNNKIEDVRSLTTLKNLTYLSIYRNQISNIEPFSCLKNLLSLGIGKNPITDFTPLSSLTSIIELGLNSNLFVDIKPLINLKKLKGLGLNHCQISNIEGLQNLVELTGLGLQGNEISDITPLGSMEKLTTLYLARNKVKNLEPLRNLINLTDLELFENQIFDIEPLSNLERLTNLDLGQNKISTIAPLPKLKRLIEVDFSKNKIFNLAPLSKLYGIQWLDLSENEISDVEPLNTLKSLEGLILSENRIDNIAPLVKLKALKILKVEHNRIVDFEAPLDIENLIFFNCQNNKLNNPKSVKSLMEGFPALDIRLDKIAGDGIYLGGNPLPQDLLIAIGKGKETINDYFNRLEKEEQVSDNELKVIFIGNSGTGKTTLREMIQNEKPPQTQNSTHGLEILRKSFKINKKEYFLNLFDFGGQEYYHDTHHFFFSHQSLYILLWDSFRNHYAQDFSRDGKLPSEQFPLEYWLGAVRFYAQRSFQRDTLNEEDWTRLLLLHNSFSESLSPHEGWPPHLKDDYTFIDNPLEIRLNPENPERTELIAATLKAVVPELVEGGRQTILEGYHNIRQRLMEGTGIDEEGGDALPWYTRKENLKSYFSGAQFEHETDDSLFAALGVMEVKGLVHTISLPISKNETKDYVIFRPKELADRIYRVLEESVGRKVEDLEAGEFDKKHLVRSLKDEKEEVQELVEHFLLSRKIVFRKDDRYVAPQYLSLHPKKETLPFLELYKKAHYRYNYQGFLHRNIIIRIFSALSDYFKKMEQSDADAAHSRPTYFYWRNGFVLTKTNSKGEAENLMVKLDREQNLLGFYEWQPSVQLSELLELVLNTIDGLNHSEGFADYNPKNLATVTDSNRKFSNEELLEGELQFFSVQHIFQWARHRDKQQFVNLEVGTDGEAFIPLWLLAKNAEDEIPIFQFPIKEKDENGKWIEREHRFELEHFQELLAEISPHRFHKNKTPMKKAFISYASEDEAYRKDLEKQLKSLERQSLLGNWNDGKLVAGEEWDERIQNELREADVVLLLISSDFISSEYIWENELKKALARHNQSDDKVVVVPIMIRHCEIEGLPFAKLQMPNRARPINDFGDKDKAWKGVVKALKKAIKEPLDFKQKN